MTPALGPSGLGFWIAFEAALDIGPKGKDLEVAIQRCKRANAKWVALRAGAGGWNDGQFDESTLAAFIDAGIDPYVWIFDYASSEKMEVSGFSRAFKAGAKGAILNAEFPYKDAGKDAAKSLVDGVRAAWYSATSTFPGYLPAFVAHAPPDYLGACVGHAPSEALVTLDIECDAIMPQVYAWEHDDHGHAYHLKRVCEGYQHRGLGPDHVWPIGCTYRPKSRGGQALSPIANEADIVASDVIEFLDHPLMSKVRAPSLYSLDAISFINGESDRVMEYLEKWAKITPQPGPTFPDTPATPIGWEIKP